MECGGPVGGGFVEVVRECSAGLVGLDGVWGGSAVLPQALRLFWDVSRTVRAGAYDVRVERDLLAAAGEAGEIAAWLAYDADRPTLSRRLVRDALVFSRRAGDRDMERFQLTHLAMHATYVRRATETVRITDCALRVAQPARVGALFEIRRGRALAQLGDERGARLAFGRAGQVLDDSVRSRDPQWTWWLDATELARHRAVAFGHLGRWDLAIPLQEQIAADGGLYAGLDLVLLLNSLVQVREWRRVEEVIAAFAGRAVRRGRTAKLLRVVCERIVRDGGAPSVVSDAAMHLIDRCLYGAPADAPSLCAHLDLLGAHWRSGRTMCQAPEGVVQTRSPGQI